MINKIGGLRLAVAQALGLGIAVSLTAGRRPPTHPVQWMRLNMVVLLVVIFLGSATRHMRLLTADIYHEPTVTAAH